MNSAFSFFQGKKIFITGDTGFKGSWLALWLQELGAEVMGFALPPKTEKDHYNLLNLPALIQHVDGDIRDHSALESAVNRFQPEIMFHLAAQALVKPSYNDPKTTFDTNIAGSVNILEAVRKSASLRSVIFVTSDKCYKNKEWLWGYRENDELGGHDPYSASKAAAEIVFSSYLESYFKKARRIGVASVRAGNVIGGGDWAVDRIVPDCINALLSQKPIVLRNPFATRPWQHVLEPLSGYLQLAVELYNSPERYMGGWNFGPNAGSVKNVGLLAEKIIEIWGAGDLVTEKVSGNHHEAGLLQLNCDKAKSLLNWIPRWDFDRSVDETIKWYKQHADGASAVSLSKNQIRQYMET